MQIKIRCAGCRSRFKVDAKHAGRKIKCPKCGAGLTIPEAADRETAVERSDPSPVDDHEVEDGVESDAAFGFEETFDVEGDWPKDEDDGEAADWRALPPRKKKPRPKKDPVTSTTDAPSGILSPGQAAAVYAGSAATVAVLVAIALLIG